MPFSTPTKLGTWLTLLPTAALSTVGACWAPTDHARTTRATSATTPMTTRFMVSSPPRMVGLEYTPARTPERGGGVHESSRDRRRQRDRTRDVPAFGPRCRRAWREGADRGGRSTVVARARRRRQRPGQARRAGRAPAR